MSLVPSVDFEKVSINTLNIVEFVRYNKVFENKSTTEEKNLGTLINNYYHNEQTDFNDELVMWMQVKKLTQISYY